MLRRTAQDPPVPLGGFVGRLPTRFRRLARPGTTTRPAATASPRLLARLVAAALVVVAIALLAVPAQAQDGDDGDRERADEVLVINVSGLIDPVVVSFIEQSL